MNPQLPNYLDFLKVLWNCLENFLAFFRLLDISVSTTYYKTFCEKLSLFGCCNYVRNFGSVDYIKHCRGVKVNTATLQVLNLHTIDPGPLNITFGSDMPITIFMSEFTT